MCEGSSEFFQLVRVALLSLETLDNAEIRIFESGVVSNLYYSSDVIWVVLISARTFEEPSFIILTLLLCCTIIGLVPPYEQQVDLEAKAVSGLSVDSGIKF